MKQKLNNKSSNNNVYNINPIMMNQNINPMIMQGFFRQPLNNIDEKIRISLKTKNGDFENVCLKKIKYQYYLRKII